MTASASLFAWITATGAAAAGHTTRGIFALPNASAKVTATLQVDRTGPLSAKLTVTQTQNGSLLRRYDDDMTKPIHMIVIDAALTNFQHVHPELDTAGRFTTDLHVPRPGGYYVYADTVPHGIGQQVFRFAVSFGSGRPVARRLVASGSTFRTGSYTVSLATLTLRAGATTRVPVRITKGGSTARDLRPYLGGAAHAVFVDATTLAYVHVHPSPPGAMSGMTMDHMNDMKPLSDAVPLGGAMTLEVAAARPGPYKLWFQFRGSDGLHVAPFVLIAR